MWKDIIGYEGLYKISVHGFIYNVKKDRYLPISLNKTKYQVVCLNKDKKFKSFYGHRLVAIHFLDNPNSLNEVNHKNGNKSDNRVENLEWCTRQYNCKHSFDIGLRVCARRVKVTDKETGEIFNSLYEAADHYNMPYDKLSKMSRNPKKQHLLPFYKTKNLN